MVGGGRNQGMSCKVIKPLKWEVSDEDVLGKWYYWIPSSILDLTLLYSDYCSQQAVVAPGLSLCLCYDYYDRYSF